jgi:hypothetical protein
MSEQQVTLTAPQRKALEYLHEHSDPFGYARVSPSALAHHLWPDSAAWTKRTRHYGSNNPGQVGGTMPMKAASLLHRLAAKGLAQDDKGPGNNWVSAWTITYKGEQYLRDTTPTD